jgi:hypothetical protein
LPLRSKPLVLLSIILVLAGALGGWHTPDDLDEYAAFGSHDARVAAPTDRIAPEHCALCHWLQALGKAAPPAVQVIAADSSQLVHSGALPERVHTTARLSLSSRAPPLV